MTEEKKVKHLAEKTRRNRNRWIIAVLVIISIVLGGKVYMDTQIEQEQQYKQEKEIAIQAKGMFKDIKSIKIGQRYISSPGTINFDMVITQNTGNEFSTSIAIGNTSYVEGHEAFVQKGKTNENIYLTLSNGKSEEVK